MISDITLFIIIILLSIYPLGAGAPGTKTAYNKKKCLAWHFLNIPLNVLRASQRACAARSVICCVNTESGSPVLCALCTALYTLCIHYGFIYPVSVICSLIRLFACICFLSWHCVRFGSFSPRTRAQNRPEHSPVKECRFFSNGYRPEASKTMQLVCVTLLYLFSLAKLSTSTKLNITCA